jgi:hypothetical protein
VRTGDAEWDARFVAFGSPREVLLDLLDTVTRRWMLDFYGPMPDGLFKPLSIDPNIRTEAGYLLFHKHLRKVHGMSAIRSGYVPSPDELREWLEIAIGLADRACAAFDRAHAAIAAVHGPAAAAGFVAEHRGAMDARTERRRKLRTIIYLVIGALVVLPILFVVLLLAFVFLPAS